MTLVSFTLMTCFPGRSGVGCRHLFKEAAEKDSIGVKQLKEAYLQALSAVSDCEGRERRLAASAHGNSSRLLLIFCLLLSLASPSISSAAEDVVHVLPPESQPLIEKMIAEPFPKPCGATLESAKINQYNVELKFQGADSFDIKLIHPSRLERSHSFFHFAFENEPSNCPEALSLLAPLFVERIQANPWKEIRKKANGRPDAGQGMVASLADGMANGNTQPLRSLQEDSNDWLNKTIKLGLPINFVLSVLLILALLASLLLVVCICIVDLKKRDLRPLILAVITALPIYFTSPLPTNWYSIFQFDWHQISSDFPTWRAYTTFLGTVLPEGASVFSAVVAINQICYVLSVVLIYHLFRKAKLSQNIAFIAALMFGIVPVLRQLGAGDCQHLVVLCLWLLAGELYRRFVEKDAHPLLLPALIVVILLATTTRIETFLWFMVWPLLFKPESKRAIRQLLLVLAICSVFILPLTLLYFQFDLSRFHFNLGGLLKFLKFPFDLWGGLLEPVWINSIVVLPALAGLYYLVIESRSRAFRLVAAVCLVAMPTFFSDYSPGKQLENRYFLAIYPLIFIFFAKAMDNWMRSAKIIDRLLHLALTLSLLVVVFHNILQAYPVEKQFTFRNEFLFLEEAAAKIPQGSTICMVDPQINHHLLKAHSNDMDTSFAPKRDQGRYMGLSVKFLSMRGPKFSKSYSDDAILEEACDYYYRTSACDLQAAAVPDIAKRDKYRWDSMRRVKDYCDLLEKNNRLSEVHRSSIRWKWYGADDAPINAYFIPKLFSCR